MYIHINCACCKLTHTHTHTHIYTRAQLHVKCSPFKNPGTQASSEFDSRSAVPTSQKTLRVCYKYRRFNAFWKYKECFQAPTAVQVRHSSFCGVTRCRLVVSCRRFGIPYQSHLRGSRILEDGTDRLFRNVGNLRCLVSRKGDDVEGRLFESYTINIA